MQPKILLVDDREDNLMSIEAIFEPDGYRFVKANSGRQALKILLSEYDFALILMDTKSLESVSFQLSFLSVFALILSGRMINQRWQWADCLTTILSLLMLAFLIVLFYFNIFSPISILANLLAVPLFHFSLLAILSYLVFFYIPFF